MVAVDILLGEIVIEIVVVVVVEVDVECLGAPIIVVCILFDRCNLFNFLMVECA